MTAPAWTQPAGGFLGGQTTLDAITLSFRYDGLSRRISKKVTITKNGVVTSTMEGYLYEGWNPVMITKLDPAASSETVLTRKWSCLWRPDVGSSLYARSSWQQAGGVGGLAWMQTGAAQDMASDNNPAAPSLQGSCEIHIPMADHMGNIRNYLHARSTALDDGSGTGSTYAMVNFTPSANFEYDAFGREVRANGTTVAATNTPPGLTVGTAYADTLPFHFSSKFTDPESGLNYYGYRYYDPKDGRWLGRDPIGERGGCNLYCSMENLSVNAIDFIGLETKTVTMTTYSESRLKNEFDRKVSDARGGINGQIELTFDIEDCATGGGVTRIDQTVSLSPGYWLEKGLDLIDIPGLVSGFVQAITQSKQLNVEITEINHKASANLISTKMVACGDGCEFKRFTYEGTITTTVKYFSFSAFGIKGDVDQSTDTFKTLPFDVDGPCCPVKK
jgi:RHS repeat-associated protein